MSEEKKVITCSECGNEHEEQVKFCSNCGAEVKEAALVEAAETTGNEAVVIESAPVTEELPPEREPVFQPVDNSDYVEAPSRAVHTMVQPAISVSAPTSNGSPGFAIASLTTGILSLICCCAWPLSLVLSIVAIGLGIVAIYNKYDGKGMAIAGIIIAGISLVAVILIDP